MKDFLYIKMKLVVMLIFVLGFINLCGCERNQGESMVGVNVSEIKMGDIFEKKENPFQEGLEHEFSIEELDEFTECCNEVTQKISANPRQDDLRYIASYYNESGDEVLCLAIDKLGNIYSEDGYRIENDKLDEFFRKIIGN